MELCPPFAGHFNNRLSIWMMAVMSDSIWMPIAAYAWRIDQTFCKALKISYRFGSTASKCSRIRRRRILLIISSCFVSHIQYQFQDAIESQNSWSRLKGWGKWTDIHWSWAWQMISCVSAWCQWTLSRPFGHPSCFHNRKAQTAISPFDGNWSIDWKIHQFSSLLWRGIFRLCVRNCRGYCVLYHQRSQGLLKSIQNASCLWNWSFAFINLIRIHVCSFLFIFALICQRNACRGIYLDMQCSIERVAAIHWSSASIQCIFSRPSGRPSCCHIW